MKVLVAALETRIAPALGAMTRHKWDLVEELSEDTSQYMLDIVSAARETMPQAIRCSVIVVVLPAGPPDSRADLCPALCRSSARR